MSWLTVDGVPVEETSLHPKAMDDRPRGALGVGDWTGFQKMVPSTLSVVDGAVYATCLSCNQYCRPDSKNPIRVGAIIAQEFTDNSIPGYPMSKWRWVPMVRKGYGCEECRSLYRGAKKTVGEGLTAFIDISEAIEAWRSAGRQPLERSVPIEAPIEAVNDTCHYCSDIATFSQEVLNASTFRTYMSCNRHKPLLLSDMAAVLSGMKGTNNGSPSLSRRRLGRGH